MTSETITYSTGSIEDAGNAALVIERAYACRDHKPIPQGLETSDQQERLLARLAEPGRWIYVAKAGQAAVAVALGYPKIEDGSPIEYLSMLAVDPDYWGQHIASNLLDIVVAHAKNTGKQRLGLWTRQSNNERARSLYEHKGFTLTDKPSTRPDGDSVEYILDL
jgi:ribosomal protein S18 acetylase RimI-like enzyme